MTELKSNSVLKKVAMFLLWVCLFLLAFAAEREQFLELFALYFIAFIAYLYLCSKQPGSYFYLGLGIRFFLLFSLPNLSEDYLRFLWDGELVRNGIGPYLYAPDGVFSFLLEKSAAPDFVLEIHQGMNSSQYYSVYPPINQWLFFIASVGGSVSVGVFVLKVFVLAAEIGVFYILRKLLQRFSKPEYLVNWYWLNPLVLVELMGNCHFEGVMLFFFLMANYQFARLKDQEGAFYFAFSVLSKLFSLMFLPLLLFKMWGKRALIVSLIIVVLVAACFVPFVSVVEIKNVLTSFDLYFQRFEFNGGIYNLIRSLGIYFTGYNQIQWIGPLLAIFSLVLILLISFIYRFKNRFALFTGFLLINGVYLFFSPIVHPWYLVMLIGFSVLSHYKFPIVWSASVFLSYNAYHEGFVQENVVFLFIEYLAVFVALYFDVRKHFSFLKLKAALSVA